MINILVFLILILILLIWLMAILLEYIEHRIIWISFNLESIIERLIRLDWENIISIKYRIMHINIKRSRMIRLLIFRILRQGLRRSRRQVVMRLVILILIPLASQVVLAISPLIRFKQVNRTSLNQLEVTYLISIKCLKNKPSL